MQHGETKEHSVEVTSFGNVERRQMDRIEARLQQPKFIERVGKEKCDLMYEELKQED